MFAAAIFSSEKRTADPSGIKGITYYSGFVGYFMDRVLIFSGVY